MMIDDEFYKKKRVLITGHTGFKGTWMSRILTRLGADVYGYALEAEKESMYRFLRMDNQMTSYIGDIRDFEYINKVFERVKPEIVFHLAAQPLVRESYKNPRETYEINVMGTVNVCEAIRKQSSVISFLNVTTDKVYHNNEWEWGYRETDPLDGFDPYSNSKSCSELVTHAYINSFFNEKGIPVSTARAGNVIGGGDFAADRIIPDCVRAVLRNQPIIVRNPYSTRPYQHVLEPLTAYLMIAEKQAEDIGFADFYNVGPQETDCISTGELVEIFCETWGNGANWINQADQGPHEAGYLKLDCSKLKGKLRWKPQWHIQQAIEKTVEWTKLYECCEKKPNRADELLRCTDGQIEDYLFGEYN